ncbi:MAG: YidC/Oxa1 family membrane protein insertase, partial [Rhodanobacter sp.]
LYAALMTISQYLEGSGFFWIPDLAFPNVTQGMGWVTDFFSTGRYLELAAYLVLPILLMVTQFIMQKYMTPMAPSADGQAKTTQQITLIMTFMFGFFTLQVPAGLTLYWVTSNLLQMGQQWFMMRNTPVLATSAGVVDSTATPVSGSLNNANKSTKSGKAEIAKPTIVKPSTTIQSTSAKSSGKRKGGK